MIGASTPSVQYAAAPTGGSVALCQFGTGSPLVVVPAGPWDTLEAAWRVAAWRDWLVALAAHRSVVRYDLRGTGLSERSGTDDFQLEAQVEDLATVLARLRLERVALFAAQHAGPAALAFAAEHPEQVSHVILWCTYARGVDYFASKQSQAVHGMLGHDWELFTRTVSHAQLGWPGGSVAHELDLVLREGLAPETVTAFDAAASEIDVTPLLTRVRAHVAVLHPRQVQHPDLAISRQLAATIPDARLIVLEGTSIAPFVGDTAALLGTIDDVLGVPRTESAGAVRPRGGALAEPLSEREHEVLRLVAAGFSNREIASHLVISPGTAKTHTASIYRKLDVGNRTRAVARARELGLLEP
jgi:DNA-binding CsgD family transcriptional regulator/pimeloyl-ACP methyl ester carboxylesterase